MRMTFRNFLKIDEAGLGSFLPGGRTTGLPLDAPAGWEFPDMHEPVTQGPRMGDESPWATSFSQAAQLNVRDELMMKLNTLQRMANVVKSLVSYKIDPGNAEKVRTGKSIIDLDYEFVPSLEEGGLPQNSKIYGVHKENILSSGLQTHGLQINPAEIGWLEKARIMRTNPYDNERYDIDCRRLYKVMMEVRNEYQDKMRMGHGLDQAVDVAVDLIQRGGQGSGLEALRSTT